MADPLESVKAAADEFRRIAGAAERSGRDPQRYETHAGSLEQVATEVARLLRLTTALPADMNDLFDLPAEVRAELSVAKTDELEDQLVTVINAHGGEATLDQILVGLYRKFGVSQKRRFIQNKLYRMTKSDMVWAVPGRKGVYSTSEQEATVNGAHEEDEEETERTGGWGSIKIPDDDIPF